MHRVKLFCMTKNRCVSSSILSCVLPLWATVATLSDRLKNIAPVFQPMRSTTKTNRTLLARFFRASSKLQVIARNSAWFTTLFAPVMIGQSAYGGIGFSTVI